MADAVAELLLDIESIKRLKARYFRLIDTKRWEELRDVFTEDCRANFSRDDLPSVVGRSDIIHQLRKIEPPISVHHGHMPEIELTGKRTATGVWSAYSARFSAGVYSQETTFGEESELHVFGLYWEEYRKDPDECWRISSITYERLKAKQVDSGIDDHNDSS
jgi:hypothetical protein